MNSFFRLRERGTTPRTEVAAGFTTFMTMAYILAVNPAILSVSGMEYKKVFSATAITSAIATLIMGLGANLPFALSAGMGLNAFFTYTVCLGMGYSWQWALSAILVEGLIFILLTILNAREALIASIPASLKKAIGAGIGLFIAYIGLQNADIVVPDASTASALSGTWFSGASAVALIGLAVTAALLVRKVRGALLIGIIVTTIIGIPFGVTRYAGGSYLPAAPYFAQFAFREIFASGKAVFDFIVVTFTFLFVDLFDTVGTFIACAGKSGLIREDGSIPNCKQALFADSVGTTVGALLGTSTVTTFVESASGVAAGARTGLTSVTVSVLFLLSLFLSPLFASIPSAATAPALIIVGVMMVTPVTEIDFNDYTEGIPAFITIIIMVCAYSISDGIMFGIFSYALVKTAAGRMKEINAATWVLVLLFAAKIAVQALL
ncbi:MAG: NCS2 family permease [Oscillospiraceae bacterium]|nr:NCS2 family permease [Oscillospiraceae bacterium]